MMTHRILCFCPNNRPKQRGRLSSALSGCPFITGLLFSNSAWNKEGEKDQINHVVGCRDEQRKERREPKGNCFLFLFSSPPVWWIYRYSSPISTPISLIVSWLWYLKSPERTIPARIQEIWQWLIYLHSCSASPALDHHAWLLCNQMKARQLNNCSHSQSSLVLGYLDLSNVPPFPRWFKIASHSR